MKFVSTLFRRIPLTKQSFWNVSYYVDHETKTTHWELPKRRLSLEQVTQFAKKTVSTKSIQDASPAVGTFVFIFIFLQVFLN